MYDTWAEFVAESPPYAYVSGIDLFTEPPLPYAKSSSTPSARDPYIFLPVLNHIPQTTTGDHS